MTEYKNVDVIIPTYHPGKKFQELLRRLLLQTYPVNRIIIMDTVDEGDAQEPCRAVGKYAALFTDSPTKLSVYPVPKREFNHGGTRHLGMTKSGADICIMMTQDALPANRRLVEELVRALDANERAAVAYARQLPAADCGVIERYTRAFNYPKESCIKTWEDKERLGIKTYFCSNVCAAYKRERYLELGGFPLLTIFNEDMIFAGQAIQAGYAVAYAAEARVIHSHNYTAAEQLRRNFDLAISQADCPEIFAGVSSESEGKRLVKQTASYLLRTGRWYLLPKLVLHSGMKYLGYRLGRRYRRLPNWMLKRLTMNRAYWGWG